MNAIKKKDVMYIVLFTLTVNILLFIFIPALSKIEQQRQERLTPGMAVTLSDKDIPEKQPPKEIKHQPKKNEPKKEFRPKKGVLKQTQKMDTKPQMDIDTPEFDIPLDLDVDQGMAVKQVMGDQQGQSHGPGLPAAFEFEEVDQPPRALRKVSPVYPHEAKQENIEGQVILRFLVNAKGNVEKPKVVFAKPKGVFEQKALEAIRKWKFKPGEYEGKKVRTWVMLPIEFKL
jgi:protein TonB